MSTDPDHIDYEATPPKPFSSKPRWVDGCGWLTLVLAALLAFAFVIDITYIIFCAVAK